MPADYAGVLKTLGRAGDFKGNVLKVNVPRADVTVAIDGVNAPTPFGFGGWIAMTKGDGGMEVMMGDLVLTEREVNPVMSAVLDAGLEVTALHNHFFFDTPRMYYMHVHGMGTAAQLATKIKPALDLIGKNIGNLVMGHGAPLPGGLTTERMAAIIGTPGEQTGPSYKITIGRPDLDVREHGAAHRRQDGPQHLGGVHRVEQRCAGGRRRRDDRRGSDAGPEGAARRRTADRRHSPSHADRAAGRTSCIISGGAPPSSSQRACAPRSIS